MIISREQSISLMIARARRRARANAAHVRSEAQAWANDVSTLDAPFDDVDDALRVAGAPRAVWNHEGGAQ